MQGLTIAWSCPARHFVHGDARPSNVMVRVQDGVVSEFRLIDMDWSGVQGVDRYLVPPNPVLGLGKPRPLAVVLGAIVQQQHDMDTMDASLGF